MRPRSLILLLALVGGCFADNPEPSRPPGASLIDAAAEDEPFIDLRPLPPLVEFRSLRVQGRGPREGSVTYSTGGSSGPNNLVRIGADGEFCLDLPLSPGMNVLTLKARNKQGRESAPYMVQIEQRDRIGSTAAAPSCP
jgi:hypothetical protein